MQRGQKRKRSLDSTCSQIDLKIEAAEREERGAKKAVARAEADVGTAEKEWATKQVERLWRRKKVPGRRN